MTDQEKERLRISKAKRINNYNPFGVARQKRGTTVPDCVTRITVDTIGAHHGIHKFKHLIVSMVQGDLIKMWPAGTPSNRAKTISVFDVYDYAIKKEVTAANMEKLREKKAKRSIHLARLRQRAAEARLTRQT